MKKIFYVITKQLDGYDGYEETNGLKDVTAYVIDGDNLNEIASIELANSDESESELLEHLESEGLIDENETVKLIEL